MQSRHITQMKLASYAFIAVILGAGVAAGYSAAPAYAGCLPGQTCWQVPQLQNNPVPPLQNDALQQQVIQDRGAVIQDRQKLITDRAKHLTPPGSQTPLDRIQQREQVRQDRDQVLQSQQSLQQSQQRLLDQQRPAPPSPYIIRPK